MPPKENQKKKKDENNYLPAVVDSSGAGKEHENVRSRKRLGNGVLIKTRKY